jgi:hypothetical protein
MTAETKTCQNCKRSFVIEPEDFEFYAKIKVPAPTFCPECRMQRRMAFRNERILYRRSCDSCKKIVIGIYPEQVPFPVYCQDCWYSDKWDSLTYSVEYDFSRPFFEQFKDLQNKVPRMHTNNYPGSRMVNSDYTNCAGDLNNCYLVFGALSDWNCYYCHYTSFSRDTMDVLYSINNERCYECLDIEGCYNVLFSQSSIQCRDSAFLFDCKNCSDCIGCTGLRNRSYSIFNRQYSKEDYFAKKAEFGLDSYKNIQTFKTKFLEEIYFSSPRKYYHGQMNKGFSGDYLSNSEETFNAFYTKNARSSRFLFWCINALDTYDYFAWGDIEFLYECVATGDKAYNIKFCQTSWSGITELEYCDLCMSSSNLFGCIGLRNKQYCILNKQYTKEEYEILVERIKKHMNEMPYKDTAGCLYSYGEYPPIQISAYAYNESVAQEHFPLTKDDAIRRGYIWREQEEKQYNITLKAGNLLDKIEEVQDSITKELISCLLCKKAYRILADELVLLRQQKIPLPRLCPDCRHKERVKLRNPLRLWHRGCQCSGDKSSNGVYTNAVSHQHGSGQCPNEFETSYAPERPEIVYCEQCYNKEVV